MRDINKIGINKKYLFFFLSLILLGGLVFSDFVFASSCPSKTTVKGTSVTFVGELTDNGGDSATSVWFEYGKTTNYGNKTQEKSLYSPKLYCIDVSGLDSCTTYQYRAVARNSAGASYGNNESFTTTCGDLTLDVFARNLSDNTTFSKQALADPSEIVSFLIKVKAGSSGAKNVNVKDIIPQKMSYQANSLKINGTLSSGDIFSSLNLGDLAGNEEKKITFNAQVAGSESFGFGESNLNDSASVSGEGLSSISDNARVIVAKKAVLGATTVSTGLTNNIFFDSFFIPLIIALGIVWLLKTNIIDFEQWLDKKKKGYRQYKTNKLLQLKIRKIKFNEWLKNANGQK